MYIYIYIYKEAARAGAEDGPRLRADHHGPRGGPHPYNANTTTTNNNHSNHDKTCNSNDRNDMIIINIININNHTIIH